MKNVVMGAGAVVMHPATFRVSIQVIARVLHPIVAKSFPLSEAADAQADDN
jgi:hypothetical protein